MSIAFDHCPDRPEHIDAVLNGLDRYNPETTTAFQDYVVQQCENQTYDCYANLALLKLYQFNPHLARDETITNVLVKSLTVFPSPDFSLSLSILPPHVLSGYTPPKDVSADHDANEQHSSSSSNNNNRPSPGSLAEAVQKLTLLNSHLVNARYEAFWECLDGDDLLADLIADVQGFEELMRVRMAVVISQSMQSVDGDVLAGWLNMSGNNQKEKFEKFIKDVCGWKIDGKMVEIPLNKENEAKSTVVRENVKFEQFGRTIKRAFEQPV